MASTWLLDNSPAGRMLDAAAVARLLDAGDGRAPALEMLNTTPEQFAQNYKRDTRSAESTRPGALARRSGRCAGVQESEVV